MIYPKKLNRTNVKFVTEEENVKHDQKSTVALCHCATVEKKAKGFTHSIAFDNSQYLQVTAL